MQVEVLIFFNKTFGLNKMQNILFRDPLVSYVLDIKASKHRLTCSNKRVSYESATSFDPLVANKRRELKRLTRPALIEKQLFPISIPGPPLGLLL